MENQKQNKLWILSQNPVRALRPIIGVSCLLLLIATRVQAEWTDEGVELGFIHPIMRFQMLPDGEGGAWIASTQATGGVGGSRCMVQRVNSEGELHFSVLGLHVVEGLEANTRLQGMVSDGQGGVIVAFSGLLPADSLDRIYAQRFSPDGERLAGPNGRRVSVDTGPGGEFSHTGLRHKYYVASDMQGGIWVWWRTFVQFNIYVNGLNADGSSKCPDGDLFFGEYDHEYVPKMAADSLGGAYLVWGMEEPEPDETLWLHHILADGTTETADPYPAIESVAIDDDYYPVTRLGGDGLYITSVRHVQRISLPLDRPWGVSGIGLNIPPPHDVHVVPPIVLADNSVVQMLKKTWAGDDSLYYARVREDGILAVSNKFYSAEYSNSFTCDSMPHTNGYWSYIFHGVGFSLGGGDYNVNFRVHCVDTTGTDLFAGDSVYVWSTQYDHPSEYATGYKPRAVKASDESYIFATPYADGSHTMLGFKMYSDGSWAGRPWTDVDEVSADTAIPVRSTMLSVYPNPFNPQTTIEVHLPETAELNVTVYNVNGQQVAKLVDGEVQAGVHQYTFDSRNRASGLYFIQAATPGQRNQVQKVMLVR